MGDFNLGFVGDFLFGDVRSAKKSGIFEGAQELGTSFSDALMEQLTTPAGETEAFNLGSQAIRDQLGAVSATQRQRLGNSAVGGGFLDSGAVSEGLAGIDRAEIGAFGRSISDLLLSLDERRFNHIMPFLGGASQEHQAIQGMNINADIQARGQNQAFVSDIVGAAGGIAGAAVAGCWVARAIYGERNPKWLLARHYIFRLAPSRLRRLYMLGGPSLAEKVKRDPRLRETLRPVFDGFVAAARLDLSHG